MKEKSQIEDMRAALRGDIERARARREADPWRAQEPDPVVVEGLTPEESVPEETFAEPVAVGPVEEPVVSEGLTPAGSVPEETVAEPAPEAEPPEEEVEPAPSPQPTTEPDAQRKNFFARLFRRS